MKNQQKFLSPHLITLTVAIPPITGPVARDNDLEKLLYHALL